MILWDVVSSTFGAIFGFLVALAYLRRDNKGAGFGAPWLAACALAPGFGFGALSIAYFGLIYVTDRNLGRLGVLGLMAVMLFAAWWLGTRRIAKPWTTLTVTSMGRWPRGVAVFLAGATLIGALIVFFYVLWANPEGGNDAIAIWNVRARFIHGASGDYVDLFKRMSWCNDYPLMLPCSSAALFSVAGEANLMVTRTTALAFFLGIPLLGVFLFGQIGRSTWAPHFAVILFTTSMFPHRTAWQYSDVPLAYFLLAAVGFLASTLHSDISRRLPLPLAGFFVGCLTWTKNEGSALAGMLVFAYGLVRWTSPEFRKATLRSLSLITLGAVSPVAALVTFRLAWSPESNFVQDIEANFIDHALSPARWIGSAVGYWETLTDWERWGLTWPILAVCWLVGLTTSRWFRAPLLRFGVLSAAGCSIGWYMIYVFTPLDQQWHIMTSLDRLALQLLPMLTFWGLVIFGTVNAKMEGLDDLLTPSLSPV